MEETFFIIDKNVTFFSKWFVIKPITFSIQKLRMFLLYPKLASVYSSLPGQTFREKQLPENWNIYLETQETEHKHCSPWILLRNKWKMPWKRLGTDSWQEPPGGVKSSKQVKTEKAGTKQEGRWLRQVTVPLSETGSQTPQDLSPRGNRNWLHPSYEEHIHLFLWNITEHSKPRGISLLSQ